LHQAIDAVEASGGTYISGGLQAGRELLANALGVRRLVLVSDGRPTAGATSEYELTGLVGRVHDQAITVTALGVGDDYDGLLMQRLAERGGGMYGYLQDAASLEEVLAREVGAARVSVLRNVVVELAPEAMQIVEVPGRHVDQFGGRAVLHLPDLRPNVPTTVYVRLRSQRVMEGDAVSLGATVQWQSRLDDKLRRVTAQVGVVAVDDPSVVEASRDEAVYSRGIKAVGSLQLVAAAAAYERGDHTAASLLLGDARKLFGMSADALAGEAEVERVRRDFSQATPEQRKSLNLGLQKKLMVDFGKGGEGY
jgi:Ca-activated chloride channel family protein